MLALEERKPFHKIETIVSIGSQKRDLRLMPDEAKETDVGHLRSSS